jgi:membrane protein YqaA with SNARE-associated domain
MQKFRGRISRWAHRYAGRPVAVWVLAAESFIESAILPIPPPEILLMPMCALRPRRWVYFATISVLYSILGGVVGYFIGAFFFDAIGSKLIDAYHLQDSFLRVQEMFGKHEFLAVFTGAFSPLPYKVFTITSGFLDMNLMMLISASIAGRGIRMFVVGYLSQRFGRPALRLIFKYFSWFSLLFVVFIVLLVLLVV